MAPWQPPAMASTHSKLASGAKPLLQGFSHRCATDMLRPRWQAGVYASPRCLVISCKVSCLSFWCSNFQSVHLLFPCMTYAAETCMGVEEYAADFRELGYLIQKRLSHASVRAASREEQQCRQQTGAELAPQL